MKKRITLIIILVTFIAIGVLLFSTGGKMSDVFLNDYRVSEDGNVMSLKVGVASSIGYVRTMKERQDDRKIYLTFYSTYGLNSNIGANSEFQIDLKPAINEIYFYRGDSGYKMILQKNENTDEWNLVR